jgi:hypothetical protein
MTWLVLALLVQRDRQRWHHEVTSRVRELEDDAGALPDLPGWTYRRHGIGICLNAPDGEVLDVDFHDQTGAVVDVWFFATRVESVKDSEHWLAERRLWRWRPSLDVIVDGCEQLVDMKAAKYTQYKNHLVLAPELEARAAAVAKQLGDPGSAAHWLAELEPGGEQAHVQQYREWLRARVRSSSRGAQYLDLALPGASADDAVDLCRPFLRRKDWQAGHTIELLRARTDVPPLREVAKLLRRASLSDDHPFPVYQACAYLLERGLDRELALERFDAWSRLEQASGYHGNPMQAQFAALALRYLPDRALALVRASLRSTTPLCIQEMAALLAAIDRRWCHREISAALEEPQRGTHAYLAAALRSTTSDVAKRRAVTAFAPPTRAPDAIGFTFDEMLAAGADDLVADELTGFQALASELRERYPEDWDGSWPAQA